MYGFSYDPEAIIQDADIFIQNEIEQSRRMRRLEQSGICFHGWTQTKVAGNPEPDGLQNGQVICLEANCGMVWDSESELQDATAQAYRQNGLDF